MSDHRWPCDGQITPTAVPEVSECLCQWWQTEEPKKVELPNLCGDCTDNTQCRECPVYEEEEG